MMGLPARVRQKRAAGINRAVHGRFGVQVTASCLAALFISACANPQMPIAPLPPPEPIIQVHEVRVPVPTPCLVMIPMEPGWSDTDEALRAAGNVFDGVKLLLAGRLEAREFIHRLEALMTACVGKQP